MVRDPILAPTSIAQNASIASLTLRPHRGDGRVGPNIGRDGVSHRDTATLVGVALLCWSLCAVGARAANILALYICGLISSLLVGDGASWLAIGVGLRFLRASRCATKVGGGT